MGEGDRSEPVLPIDSLADRNEQLSRRIAWADLRKRVFEVDALRCPACGGRIQLVATITDPCVARQILECLALPTRAPPFAPTNEGGRGSAVGEGFFEATFAPTQSDPGFDFDQSATEDLCQNDAS